MSKERPVLFTGPMVRAILEGRKTQTRRIVNPQPNGAWSKPPITVVDGKWASNGCVSDLKCPYGTIGDRLYIREAWSPAEPGPIEPGMLIAYRADFHEGLESRDGSAKWKPSIHMPKWASRITLEITGVRVERLQDITIDDSIAEGMDGSYLNNDGRKCNVEGVSATRQYEKLWGKINGETSWIENPFVWVIEFKRIDGTTTTAGTTSP